MASYLYVIATADGRRRIGNTSSLARRLYQHRRTLCIKAEIELTVCGDDEFIARLERSVLSRLRRYPHTNDLFECDGRTAHTAVLDAVRGVALGEFQTISDVVAAFGAQYEFADALGVKRGRVEQWCQRNAVPMAMTAPIVWLCRSRGLQSISVDLLVEITAASHASTGAP